MKVNIRPYPSDLIPIRRWERSYEFWRSKDSFYLDESKWKWYDKLVFNMFDKLAALFLPINRWSNSRKHRIMVKVDYYDIWSADHTLALIIAPTLKKLKECQHGYPHVDNEDVPEELRTPKEDLNQDQLDSLHVARWDYILNEMIWAFEQHADGYDGESQFHHNSEQLDMVFTPVGDGKPASTLSFNHQKDPSKPPYWRDDEGIKKHQERKRNGVRLFAKYYECLWD
jgi:hypothetical protein